MRGRPLHIDWRPDDTVDALHAAYRAEQDPARKPRLQALWLMRSGHRMVEAAEAVGFTYRAVQKWLDHYRKRGRPGLAGAVQPPKPTEHLTDEQWEQVREHLRKGTTRTIDMLKRWMREQFKVEWSYSGLRKALARHRIALKVPRPRHEKTNRAAQEAWKKGGSRASSRRRSPVRSRPTAR